MLKRVGILAIVLAAGSFLCPSAASAQGWGRGDWHSDRSNSQKYRDNYRDYNRHEHQEWKRREHERRKEREHDWRERQRFDRRYNQGYYDSPRYYQQPSSGY
jgi:Ni/Co efflux regulator RcnB